MQTTKLRKYGKTFVWLMIGVLFILLIAPLVLYQHSMRLIDTMPVKAEASLTRQEIDKLWATREDCNPEECASITPYWLYRFLMDALIKEFTTLEEPNAACGNLSKMASRIAVNHLRQSHLKRKQMLWWHLTHAFLSIWLQRNWTAGEIAEKYMAIDAEPIAHSEKEAGPLIMNHAL